MVKAKDPDAVALGRLRSRAKGGKIKKPPAKVDKMPSAVAMGRKGGKVGGPARAKKLDVKKRRDIAEKGAAARWRGKK